jgi:23S rRNA (uracil1939-C5)-methyltransferase
MDLSMDLSIERAVAGGVGLGHASDGRVVLVEGALPDERVTVEVRAEHPRWLEAEVAAVLDPAPGRREPPCPAVALGCGGCDLQHADDRTQREIRREIVVDALRRLGRLVDPLVLAGPDLPTTGYRTTLRCLVENGRAGLRRRQSHEAVVTGDCLVAHPLIAELLLEGDFGSAHEVTLRAGTRTGERLVVADPTAEGVTVPDDVVVVGADELARGRSACFHEAAARRIWRISARSFFQSSPEGAEALADLAFEASADLLVEGARVVDLFGGVGWFAGAFFDRAPGLELELVERSRGAAADARHNLADTAANVVARPVEQWRPSPADVVVADPARTGLGAGVVDAVVATEAQRVVLVSCDPASLGRDAGLLVAAGYVHVSSTLVDLFPQTSHVEVVTRFDRVG